MMTATRRTAVVLVALLALLALSACVSIPTSGPVKEGKPGMLVPDNSVDIAPAPPRPGDTPKVIVEGFLQAMANYQSEYAVARQYLASSVRDTWNPLQGVQIYGSSYSITQTRNDVVLSASLTGSLDADGAFLRHNGPFRKDFGMIKDADGEWRISNPPAGLIVSQYVFDTFFQSYDTYFFEPGFRALVPDPIFLPRGIPEASALVSALLSGPSRWLKPAVVTAIPQNTQLNVGVSVDENGIADVSLSDSIIQLSDDQRSLMAAQITWTLGQLSGIEGVKFTANGARYQVRNEVPDGNYVPVNALAYLGPVGIGASTALFGVVKSSVVTIDEQANEAVTTPIAGPLGRGEFDVDSLAVSASPTMAAAVTDNQTTLRFAPIAGDDVKTLISRAEGLLRPQFSRFDELWAIGNKDGKQHIWVMPEDKKSMVGEPIEVTAPEFAQSTITAFRLSPDGARIALVRKTSGGDTELGLARVIRADKKITVDGWQPLDIATNTTLGVKRVLDIGWIDATTLAILGSTGEDAPYEPFRVYQDASQQERMGTSENWDARSLVTAPRAQSAFKVVVVGRNGEAWRYTDEFRWPRFAQNLELSQLTYPG